jgi:hypothetical protein
MIVANLRKPAYFIGAFALLGLVLLPAVFYVLSETVSDYEPVPVQLLLWPSSIIFMGVPDAEPWDSDWVLTLAVSASVNGLLYSAIGMLLWIGLFKWRWVLIPLVGGLAWGWYQLLKF